MVLEIITSSIPLFVLGSKIICLTSISILLFATNVMVGSAQQGEIQVESEEDLEATLNGDGFRTGDTITVSGTIEDPNTQSFVNIEVIDPESAIVVQAFPEITAEGAQGTASGYDFTTIAAASYIPISTKESLTEEDETEEDETEEAPLRVAFVKPSFTYAAYQINGFYNFYNEYLNVSDGTTNVTTDLNLLTVEVPDETYIYYKDDPSDTPTIPSQQGYYDTLMELVEEKASSQDLDIEIEDLSDEEVHEGDIFDSAGNNAYDVLFLFHQEYVTQAEYDNLKKFVVENGGTIVFNDANIFTVEVKYDSVDNTVTLVRGHTWAYDGTSSAWRAYPRERWINETQQWVGSNFMQDPASDDVTFSNNPFNYMHSEEQFVTNPNATIIFDFGVFEHTPNEIGDERDKQHFPYFEKVATYEMISGKGKVVNIGIFAHNLDDNEAFLDFYDEEILPRALG